MNNISVDNLFPSSKKDKHEPLTVYNLYHVKKTREKKEEEISIKALIDEKNARKQKVYDEYRKIYRLSLNKIKLANKMDKSFIFYEVPDAVYRCPDYISTDCLNYLSYKLNKLKFETEIINNNTIYINWSKIE